MGEDPNELISDLRAVFRVISVTAKKYKALTRAKMIRIFSQKNRNGYLIQRPWPNKR